MPQFIADRDYKEYERIPVEDQAVGFTLRKYDIKDEGEYKNKTAEVVFARLEGNAIRYRLDGRDPTASEGLLLKAEESLMVIGSNNIGRFRAIAIGQPGALHVMYGLRGY